MKMFSLLFRRISLPLTVVFGLTFAVPAFSQAVTGTSLSITGAGASTLSGTLSVTGATTLSNSLNVTGAIDSDNNQFTFGTQGASYGAGFFYNNDSMPGGSFDTFKFLLNRSPAASWLWVSGTTPVNVMRLDGNHQLALFQSNGTTAGVTLTPASNQISLGTATLTASGTTLTTNGALTVGGNIVNSTGSLTGGSTGLTLNAGGTNQNVTLSSSGTGDLVFNAGGAERARIKSTGNVGIGTATPLAKFNTIGAVLASSTDVAGAGTNFAEITADSSKAQLYLTRSVVGWGDTWWEWTHGTDSKLKLGFSSVPQAEFSNGQAVFFGNVGIGITIPAYKLDVNGLGQFSGATQIGNGAAVGLFNDAANLALRAPTSAGAGDIYFQTTNGSTTNMIVKNGGNVGIGTLNPAALLQVGTTIANQGFKVGLFSNAANSNAEIRTSLSVVGADSASVSVSGAVAWNYYNGGVSPSWAGTLMEFCGSGMTGNLYGLPAANQADLIFQNASSGVIASNYANIFVSPAGNVSTTFLTNGNVGIGTTTPAAKLHVVGDASGSVSFDVGASDWSPASSTGFTISPWGDGNVYLDTKLMTGGSIIYRYGEGAQTGAINTWMTVKAGNVGIGTTNPTQKLSVAGTIQAYAVVVNTGWSDYVFDENYRLAPLSEVEQTIKAQKHLPGIPSAQDVAEHGVSVGDMESKLLAKVEELTLHLIAQEKEINSLRHEVAELKTTAQH
jgi:hypothetical protein